MTESQPFKPYSSLPEPFALVAAAVWVNLLVAAAPTVGATGLLVRAVVYGMLVAVAATHSWLFARGTLVSGGIQRAAVSAGWLAMLALVLVWLESDSVAPLVGVLVFMQVAQCSFVFNHATLRLTHLVAFFAMLVSTPRLPFAGAAAAWLVFAVLSMLVLAYGRTASKAGPASYDLGERRRVVQRMTLVSGVSVVAALLFFVTPLLRWPDTTKHWQQDRSQRSPRREPSGDDPFGVGGSTSLDDDNLDIQVMLVQTNPPVRGPLYLRGQTFDSFDGASWSNARPTGQTVDVTGGGWTPLPFPKPSVPTQYFRQVTQTYTMLVNMHGVVFTACRPTQVQFPDGGPSSVFCDPSDRSLRVEVAIPASKRYRVDGFQESFADTAIVPVAEVGAPSGRRYLDIPVGIDPRVVAIAEEQTASATTPYEKAVALERYLHGPDFYYSLENDVGGSQVVNDFLLRARRGHCALFASSMVVMARSIGLPARYVTGFLAQDRTADGFYVRGSDAHAWVEVYVGPAGWIAFDPTSGRVSPTDGTTRRLARANGHNDERTDAGIDRGIGLYGRDGSDFSPSGGDAGGGSSGSSNGAGGAPSIGGGGGGGGSGGGNGSGSPEGGTPETAATGDSTPSQPASDSRSGTASDGTHTPDPSRTVAPPGGGTAPPPVAGRGASDRDPARSSTSLPATEPPPAPNAEQVKDEWRLLVTILLLGGAAIFVLLLVWQQVARRFVERRSIREAFLPFSSAEDPDPRRFVVKLYHTTVDGLGQVGYPKRAADAPADYALSVAGKSTAIGEPVAELTELFHEARYGVRPITPSDASAARGAWERVLSALRAVRG